jgi:hypothetical protein
MVRSFVLAVSVGVVLLTATPPVSADPISITGTINIIREPESGQASLSGPGFAFNSTIAWREGNVGPFACDAAPCAPGTTLDAGGQLFTTLWSGGSLTLNGVTYPVTPGIDSPATLSMEIFGSLQSPPAGEATSVRVPVTMVSQVLIDSQTRAMLRGSGHATVFFSPNVIPEEFEWLATRVQYDFTDASAVPEPTTLLLVAGGLAAGAFKRRRGCEV